MIKQASGLLRAQEGSGGAVPGKGLAGEVRSELGFEGQALVRWVNREILPWGPSIVGGSLHKVQEEILLFGQLSFIITKVEKAWRQWCKTDKILALITHV